MRVIDFLLVASWLASHVTAHEPFCSTPATWPKRPFTEAFRNIHKPFRNLFADFEVKVPEQNKTADVLLASMKHTDEYIKFKGHVSLRISLNYGSANFTDQTCLFDTNVQSSFMSGVRYWSYYELHEKIYPLSGILKYELIDTNSTVRGMTVHHSRVCFPEEQVSMEFYYTTYPSFGVRISIAGKNIPTIHYDFITPEWSTTDTYNRQIPRGVICKVVPGARDRRMPSEFRSFSATVVMVYSDINFSTFREEFYDDQAKLASSLLLVLPGSTFQRLFGHRYLRVIRDYNTDLRYVIDVHRGNCTVESMAHSTPSYVYTGPWDPAGVNANKSPGLFDLSVFPEFFYQETVIERGHNVDVYKASRVDWPRKGAKTTVAVLYTADEWVTTGMRLDDPVISLRFKPRYPNTGNHEITGGRNKLFGFWYETTAEPMSTDEVIPNSTHVYDYKEGVDDFSVFDISACYEQPKQVKRVVFSLPMCYSGLVRYRLKLFETTLREYIVRETSIETIRVGEIEVVISSTNVVDIWVTLFDTPNVIGSLPPSVSRVTLEQAVSKLKEALDARPIVVSYQEGGQSMTAIRGSLRTGDYAASFVPEISKEHSTGMIAAVVAAALCLGLIIGLTVPMCLWKRSQSTYLVQ